MKCHALFLGTLAVVMLNLPTYAADGASSIVGVRWGKNAFNFEGMPSGPQPLRNLSRLPDGKANATQLVDDFHNPILTPEAAAAHYPASRVAKPRKVKGYSGLCRPGSVGVAKNAGLVSGLAKPFPAEFRLVPHSAPSMAITRANAEVSGKESPDLSAALW
jgi:hypothetical protein